ncbi:MAG: hypothetical protein QF570_20815 [Myxococcota bacterium]|jgi:catechol 2,3-dioxygenase-like lactoylglutathione lyase family enzyme|nr:hypothetical protein [Myxococcota bacterium]
MGVVGLDHLAITEASIEETVSFYQRVLGAEDLHAQTRARSSAHMDTP